ncbi:Zinc knuckle [Popillia japonica]|uniref:Zinc knuckle n=1 Tax=Popillia japonica TaxID=7064 RepID=A0AAW1LW61_POPJA
MRQNQTAYHSSSRGCFRCGEVGHSKRDCKRNYNSEARGRSQAAYQEKPNNYEQGKRHFPQNRGTRRSSKSTKVFVSWVDKYKEIEANDKVTFFVDSGCTVHMLNKKQYFSDLVMLKNPIRIEPFLLIQAVQFIC